MNLNNCDILLVIPPPFFTKMPSIGVGYLVSYLKNKGMKVKVADLSLELYNEASAELRQFWQMDCPNSYFVTEAAGRLYLGFQKEIESFVNAILSANVRNIGFSVNMTSVFIAEKIARLIKKRDSSRVIIFGGAGVFFESGRRWIKADYVDFFVIGEGEEILFSLLKKLSKGEKINKAPGLLIGKYSNNILERFIRKAANLLLGPSDESLDMAPAPSIENLDALPFPTYSEFRLSEYNQGSHIKPIPLLTSRGCFNRCTYCIDCLMWPKYRFRSPSSVFEEIDYHLRVNKAGVFEFTDLLCNGNLKQLSEICNLIIEAGFKFHWVSYAVIRRDMSCELFDKMKRSGCHTLIYGLEHASDRVLKAMNKNYTAREAEEIIRRTHQAGICVNINIIVGFPGETEEDFGKIVKFLKRNRNFINEVTNISALTLFPESELGRFKEKYGISLEKDMDPMLFRDSNGLDHRGRKKRVAKLAKIIEALGLKRAIINRAKLPPEFRENDK